MNTSDADVGMLKRPTGKRSRLKRAIDRILSEPAKNEVAGLWRLAWPTILFSILHYSLPTVTALFCGHLGKVELAAVGIGTSFTNVTGVSVVAGLLSACDTLFSQAYGAKKKRLIGVILQRAILFTGLFVFPIAGLWLNAESLLLLIGYAKDVASQAALFVRIQIVGLPSVIVYTTLRKFLLNQNHVKLPLIVAFVITCLAVVLNSILIFGFHGKIEVAAIVQAICQFLQPFLLLGLVKWKTPENLADCWGGFSWEALYDWKGFSKLAFPGMSLTCMEWWSYEVCILISGILSTLDAATFVACFTLINVLYMVSLGFAISASVRVGQFLGADEPNNAKRTGKVAVILIALWGIVECLVLFLARNQIGRIFSNDRDVIDLIGKSLKIVCVVVFFDDLQTVVGGIYRGSGRQATGACIAFVSYYVLALPIGIPLALLTTLNAVGFWIGILCGVVFQFVAGIFVVLCSDWKVLAKKARARMEKAEANGEARGSSVEPSDDIDSDVTELLTSDESIEEAAEERLQPEVSRKGLRPKDFRAKVIRLIVLYSIGLAVLTSAGIASQYKPTNGNDNCSSNKSENVMSNLTSCVNTSFSSSIGISSTLAFTLKPAPTVQPRIQISTATIPPSSSSIKATISS